MAVDDIVVTVAPGGRGQPGGVRAGELGLGHGKTTADSALGQGPQPLLLLRRGARHLLPLPWTMDDDACCVLRVACCVLPNLFTVHCSLFTVHLSIVHRPSYGPAALTTRSTTSSGSPQASMTWTIPRGR